MKIRLTESKFRYMVAEIVQQVLLEAQMSLDDIYNKHYNGIDKDLFLVAVNADPTSKRTDDGKIIGKGVYTGWIMQLAKNGKWRPENSEETTELLTQFASYSKKNQLPQGTDIGKIKSLEELRAFLESITPRQTRSEIKGGAEKVYEDNEWLIIIPHTEETAILYGSGTKWCTAAKCSDNDFVSFNDDEKGEFLYINIDKLNKRKYQFHFESNQFMGENDRPIEPTEIGLSQGAIDYYKSIGKGKYFHSINDIKSYIQRGDYSIFDSVEDFGEGFKQCVLAQKKLLISPDNQIIGNTWFEYINKEENCDWFRVGKEDDRGYYKSNYLIPDNENGGYKALFGKINDPNTWRFNDIIIDGDWVWVTIETDDDINVTNYLIPDNENGGYKALFGDIDNPDTWVNDIFKYGDWFKLEKRDDNKQYIYNYIDINGNLLLDKWISRDEIRNINPEKYSQQKQQQNQPLNEIINRLVRNYRKY